MIRLLGIDPGLQRTGWGIIDSHATRLSFVASGVVESRASDPLAARLNSLYSALADVIRELGPEEAAIEETVVNRNPLSSLKLGHARGAVMLCAAQAGLTVTEYAARRVKRAVTGTGAGDKNQVAAMVQVLLPAAGPVSGDAADALAVAICHAHERETLSRLAGSLARTP